MFALVFVIVWCGAGVITLNAQLLGGKMYVLVWYLIFCIFPLYILNIFISLHFVFLIHNYEHASFVDYNQV